MFKRTFLVFLLSLTLVLSLVLSAPANETSTPGASPSEPEGTSRINQLSILHIATTTTTGSVQQALTDLGETFDYFSGSDWSGIDLNPYDVVIIGMDGGTVEAASVQNVANFANNGGLLIIIGGTCYANWANAVNTYLLLNNTADYCWTISSTPHLTVTDPGNPLAAGLPGSYNFLNSSAAYYQIRSLDPATSVAAVNGHGYDALFSKPIGAGNLIWFINSAYSGYWGNAADYNVLRTIISNAIIQQPDLIVSYLPTATAGKVGGLIRRLSVKYRVMNQGNADAVASELDFYLSRDTALSPDDVYAGTVNIPALAPGAQAPLPYGIANFLLPVPAPAVGAWKVLGVADANDDNAESDETNNVVSTGAVVMGR